MKYIEIELFDLRVRDSLIVLYSGIISLILRKNSKCDLNLDDGAKTSLWTVVGNCYIYNIMNNKAVEEIKGRTMKMFIN